MTDKTLVVTADGVVAWKIATVAYGSEGAIPRHPQQCPYYQQHGVRVPCISGSGSSGCGGVMGGPPGYVYCVWGLHA